MAARSQGKQGLDQQGQIPRQLGWKLNSAGKRVQHKFRLGSDPKEAARREQRLCEFWELVEEHADGPAYWDDFTLNTAKSIAKGIIPIPVFRLEDESELEYAKRVKRIHLDFPGFYSPHDSSAFAAGEELIRTGPQEPLFYVSYDEVMFKRKLAATPPVMLRIGRSESPSVERQAINHTLHDAMRGYIEWINEDYFDPHMDRITDNGRTKIRQVKTLMTRHEDVPLSSIELDTLERMFRYWRRRPSKKQRDGEPKRISRKSAQNYIGELKRFFRWLHRSKHFDWRKPEDFDEINIVVDPDPAGTQRRLVQADVFSIDELKLLNRYATPLERVFLLLGLNCGFGAKEIATLEIGDIVLNQAHSAEHQEVLNFKTTHHDSFIKRVRRKNQVYGEFILFPQAVEAMRWALERRQRQPTPQPDQPLLLNDRNEPYDKPTAGGNRNQQIANRFDDLKRRIRDDDNMIRKLSFGKLRKTAGDLVRRFADGEVAGVFLCHGSAVRTDDLADVYTNRPFGKVFEAIRRVEEYLQPVFSEAGAEPFVAKPQAYTKRRVIDKIAIMKSNGASIREIADATGKSRMTVHRHIEKLRQSGELNE